MRSKSPEASYVKGRTCLLEEAQLHDRLSLFAKKWALILIRSSSHETELIAGYASTSKIHVKYNEA